MHKFLLSLLVAAFVFSLVSVGVVAAEETSDTASPPAWGQHIKNWFKQKSDSDNCPALTDEDMAARKQQRLERGAEMLGIGVEDLQAKLDSGMTMKEIAEEAGISQEDFRAKIMEQAKLKMTERLNQLVAEGEITQEQADKRLEQMQKRIENPGNHLGQRLGKGFRGFFNGQKPETSVQ
jgi:hypothetical protein